MISPGAGESPFLVVFKKRMDMALGAIWSCWTGVELESLDLET